MKNKPALVIIFLTIFIDLLGFGIIIPLLPSFSQNVLHMNETTIGLLTGIFSLMQFLFTPFWGSLSDKYGRKPILVMSLLGSVVSYLFLGVIMAGFVLSSILLIISRAFAGIFAANISAAQAVISDVTPPEERTKGMGLLAAAFGLGFVFGPAVGGLLAAKFSYSVPVLAAAGLSLVALLLSIFMFKETLPKDIIEKNKAENKKIKFLNLKDIGQVLSAKNVAKYIFISFVLIFSFSHIFSTFQLLAERPEGLNLTEEEIGYFFSLLGVIGAFVQLFLIKVVTAKFGEVKSLILGASLASAGLFLIPYQITIIGMVASLITLAIGNGISYTVALSLVSQNTERSEQGKVLGINQSLGSFARFLGPVLAGVIYQFAGYQYPFINAAFFTFITLLFIIFKVHKPE